MGVRHTQGVFLPLAIRHGDKMRDRYAKRVQQWRYSALDFPEEAPGHKEISDTELPSCKYIVLCPMVCRDMACGCSNHSKVPYR